MVVLEFFGLQLLLGLDKNVCLRKPAYHSERGSVTVVVDIALDVAVAVNMDLAVAVAVTVIGFGSTIRAHPDIQWSPVCGIFVLSP